MIDVKKSKVNNMNDEERKEFVNKVEEQVNIAKKAL